MKELIVAFARRRLATARSRDIFRIDLALSDLASTLSVDRSRVSFALLVFLIALFRACLFHVLK